MALKQVPSMVTLNKYLLDSNGNLISYSGRNWNGTDQWDSLVRTCARQ